MAHRLRESREERNRRRRGRGSGSCGSHFIKQPRTRQRCSFRRIYKKSEFTEQNHAVKCNHKLHHDYNRVQSHIQMVALGLSCHQYFTISTLQAATSSGYSTHYHPPLFFFYSSSFIAPSVFTISSPCAAQQHVLGITGHFMSLCVCLPVYSPARSGSRSLCEAPVIVGGLLLWREQKMQYELYVSLQQQ